MQITKGVCVCFVFSVILAKTYVAALHLSDNIVWEGEIKSSLEKETIMPLHVTTNNLQTSADSAQLNWNNTVSVNDLSSSLHL